jgi:prophage regulatory protein
MSARKKISEWQAKLEHAVATGQPFDYWREPKVLDTTGLRRSTMRQMVKDGLFPPPVKLSERASGWVSLLVQDWQRQRIEQHQRAA